MWSAAMQKSGLPGAAKPEGSGEKLYGPVFNEQPVLLSVSQVQKLLAGLLNAVPLDKAKLAGMSSHVGVPPKFRRLFAVKACLSMR